MDNLRCRRSNEFTFILNALHVRGDNEKNIIK